MRTAWFVDGAYLFRSAPFDFEFSFLRERLERQLGKPFDDCFFYQPAPAGAPPGHSAFVESLQAAPPDGARARVRYVPACRGDDDGDAALAAAMTLDIFTAALESRYAALAFSAPQAYYAGVLAQVRDRFDCAVTLAAYQGTADSALHPLAEKIVWLDELWDDVG